MTTDHSKHKNFEHKLAQLIVQKLNADEVHEFLQSIKNDSRLCDELKDQLLMDATLSIHLQKTDQDFINQVLKKVNQESNLAYMPNTHVKQQKPVVAWGITALSLAACCLLTILNFSHFFNEENFDEGVAVVSNVVGLANKNKFSIGQSIHPGEIELTTGYLELEFYRGAQLKIAAPAKLILHSAEHISLDSGKLLAKVPEVARGFTVSTPNSEVVDLGTEFGLSVDNSGKTEVHVFDGLVEAHSTQGPPLSLYEGDAVAMTSTNQNEWIEMGVEQQKFKSLKSFTDNEREIKQERMIAWQKQQQSLSNDERLIVHYDFQKNNETPRKLINRASNKYHGAIIGTTWSVGPWHNKQALSFNRPSDRVRINVNHEFKQLTYAAWVRFDSLDDRYSSLLLTDGWKNEGLHWQLNKQSKLILGINSQNSKPLNYNAIQSFTLEQAGRWFHIATTINTTDNIISHYINGKPVGRFSLQNIESHFNIDNATIGNWDAEVQKIGGKQPVRNLIGAIAEFMLFDAALTEQEIKKLAMNE